MGKKIFISSTYLDLVEYRQGVWKLLNQYNVKILGMESFGARKSNVLETCVNEVKRSDIFLCIIGMKYGSIEESSTKSYTQLEYEKALECNLDILVYMIDENKGCVYPKNVDIGEKGESLRKFKEEIIRHHTPGYYKSVKDFLCSLKLDLDLKLIPLRKGFTRPKELVCKTTYFKVNGEDWIAFVGYFYDLPYEILTTPVDIRHIGRLPKIGTLEPSTIGDKEILCFSFTDHYGYKNIIGGIDYEQKGITKRFDKIISKLLVNDTPIDVIIDVIKEMDIIDLDTPNDWKFGVVKAIKKRVQNNTMVDN
ncbi:MAG: hypothetical protein A2X19_08900 [Bacteroidetes bacterium GWE2_39_28]|nr:MAG: hypothetical protein A2X19_08900 [Bacteroidetes bacterium GWE2_39_28]OFY12172.1 MAG: hypothetical protein A2X16_06395 [Bacteroidetes bacterium GWF2_39_10]OFZ06816.1 MAG: hypothetical protein A2322_03850 [Bacteroidetes bacterium RIFOXYB2_FULL_39_7]OFZ12349.1 MAG: hypothetical protein A2465_10885 [Bacteroidetes bacterium RIFOXYC2_FULL_39_11]HCT94202.1 hypothetical protein [Rikenellaceae bacterium]